MAELAIAARGLRKAYGDVTALDGLDLEVSPGQVFGLLGPNGSGKTTTVRILTTLDHAASGAAEVFGHDVARDPARVRTLIGYVPQELSADRFLTARENLAFFCDLYHLGSALRRRRIGELLDLLDLGGVADRQVRTFSGGMRKKLDLACGLVHRPRLLLLDEPSLGLDVPIRRAVWEHVRSLRAEGQTVLLCTNYMDEADRLCDRIAIVDRGRVAAAGSPAELRAALGGDVVSVELADPGELGRARPLLEALPFVGQVWHEEHAPMQRAPAGPGFEPEPRRRAQLHATVASSSTALPALLEALHRGGVAIQGARFHRPGLEEVFLRHTGHAFRNPAPAAQEPSR